MALSQLMGKDSSILKSQVSEDNPSGIPFTGLGPAIAFPKYSKKLNNAMSKYTPMGKIAGMASKRKDPVISSGDLLK